MPKSLSEEQKGIEKVYKPKDKEQELRKWVYGRFNDMKEAPKRKEMEREWHAGEVAWEAAREEDELLKEEWQSSYYIPLTTGVIESQIAEFVDQQNRPLILPRTAADSPKAMVMSNIYDFSWEIADGDLVTTDVFKGALIHGTGLGREFYLQDKRIIKEIIEFNKKTKGTRGSIKTQDRELIEFDGCITEYRSVWDVYVDEKAREFNRGTHKARDVVDRYIMNIRDARNFFRGPVWDPFNNMQYVKPGGDTDYYRYYKPPEDIKHQEDVEVLWYWARSPEDLLVVVINDVVVFYGPNPYQHKWLPFAKAVDTIRLDQFYGKGTPKLLESIQEELNTMRRMIIDRHHLDIDKTFLVSQTSTLDDEDMIARPHGVIPVDDPNNVKALEYGDLPASVQYTQKSITEDAVRVTGVDDRFQSLSTAPSTATEAAILRESTQKRIKMKITNFQKSFLRDVARMRVSNIIQFYSKPMMEEILGEQMSSEYQRELAMLAREGRLVYKGNKPMKKAYRNVRLEDKEIKFNGKGIPYEMPTNGYSFFEAKPELFMPSAREGFDIKFEAGSTMPVSKPLMQSKAIELFDRIVPVADAAGYSIAKITDSLVKAHDYNPNDFKDTQVMEEEMQQQDTIMVGVNLAAQENENLIAGSPIPANGTPYASSAHTEVHIAFMNSEAMQKADDALIEKMTQHIVGELEAQKFRSGSNGQQPQAQQPQGQGAQNNEMRNLMPNRMQGGPDVQNGLPNMAEGRL